MSKTATYAKIASQTLTTDTATVDFTSVPTDYTDLVIIVSGAIFGSTTIAVSVGNGSIDTGSNYSWTYIYGDGTTVGSGRASNQSVGLGGDVSNVSNTNTIHLNDYSNTTTYKTIFARFSASNLNTGLELSLWRSTAAINTIRLSVAGTTFNSGTKFTIYGIEAAK